MSISDEEIKKKVVEHLYWDSRVDSSDITVAVDNGKVTLKGTVPVYASKGAASSTTWGVEGVISVENLISVEFSPSFEIPSDGEIKSNIESSLLVNSVVDSSNITITVNEGIAILEGSVGSYWEKIKAKDITAGITGVVNIVDKLSVVPTERVSDQAIAEDITAAVTRNFRVSIKNVNVKVENGVVTLSGGVPDFDAYNSALNIARSTKGVIDIVDNLVIK
ncbi:MAG: Transport-associated protein [Promethearchaeota archaeon]|nr:MAG: Transport-associated protein [Candidatus Lokiarchaeota archaeon]